MSEPRGLHLIIPLLISTFYVIAIIQLEDTKYPKCEIDLGSVSVTKRLQIVMNDTSSSYLILSNNQSNISYPLAFTNIKSWLCILMSFDMYISPGYNSTQLNMTHSINNIILSSIIKLSKITLLSINIMTSDIETDNKYENSNTYIIKQSNTFGLIDNNLSVLIICVCLFVVQLYLQRPNNTIINLYAFYQLVYLLLESMASKLGELNGFDQVLLRSSAAF